MQALFHQHYEGPEIQHVKKLIETPPDIFKRSLSIGGMENQLRRLSAKYGVSLEASYMGHSVKAIIRGLYTILKYLLVVEAMEDAGLINSEEARNIAKEITSLCTNKNPMLACTELYHLVKKYFLVSLMRRGGTSVVLGKFSGQIIEYRDGKILYHLRFFVPSENSKPAPATSTVEMLRLDQELLRRTHIRDVKNAMSVFDNLITSSKVNALVMKHLVAKGKPVGNDIISVVPDFANKRIIINLCSEKRCTGQKVLGMHEYRKAEEIILKAINNVTPATICDADYVIVAAPKIYAARAGLMVPNPQVPFAESRPSKSVRAAGYYRFTTIFQGSKHGKLYVHSIVTPDGNLLIVSGKNSVTSYYLYHSSALYALLYDDIVDTDTRRTPSKKALETAIKYLSLSNMSIGRITPSLSLSLRSTPKSVQVTRTAPAAMELGWSMTVYVVDALNPGHPKILEKGSTIDEPTAGMRAPVIVCRTDESIVPVVPVKSLFKNIGGIRIMAANLYGIVFRTPEKTYITISIY